MTALASTRVRRWPAAAGALALGLLAVIVVAPQARAASPTPVTPAGVTTGPASLALLAQSTLVESGQSFHLQLAVSAPATSTRVQVVIDQRLTTRTDFDASLKGKLRGVTDYVLGPRTLAALPTDPAGGIDVDIPVDPSGSSGSGSSDSVSAFTTRSDSGVYPVQVQLLDSDGQPTGNALTTFLVYASPAAVSALTPGQGSSGLPRLDVALTVPVHEPPSLTRSGQATRLPTAESASLATLATTLGAHAATPVTLDATPQTLDALAIGNGTDRSTLGSLASLVAGGGDEVAGSTYADASLPSLVGAGMGSEVTSQITSGTSTLTADLHRSPVAGTWTVNGPLDQTTLDSLTASGVNQVVVPNADLSALPEADSQTTLAAPTQLSTRSGKQLKVINVDPGLADHFTNGGDQVLAANQLLAELAMIQLETPGETRGVAVVPPSGWQVSPTFLAIVLSGLTANPLLEPVTTTNLFSSVPVLGPAAAPLVRALAAPRPTVAAFPAAGLVRSARAAVDALGSIFPDDRTRVAFLQRQILIGEAEGLTGGQRALVIGTATAALTQLRRDISLPGASSITLTARDGGVPITVESNGAAGARVQLRLSSEKLAFQAFRPSGGECTTPSSGVEVCQLTLANEASTLKVPVVARASGVFTLDVALSSPDGAVPLSETRDTVRSTAFSGVGVILIVVAALALGYWWVRNIRHGRRARDLVPADVDEDELLEEMETPGPVPPVAGMADGDSSGAARPARAATGVAADAGDGAVGRGPPRAARHAPVAPPPPDSDARPAPPGDGTPEPADDEPPWMDEDPVIAEFFSSPAPVYPPPGPGSPRGSRS